MVNNNSTDKRITEMRKNHCGLFTIYKWLQQWDYFSQLDELLVLAHILNVLDKNNLAVSRNQVKYFFNKFYNRDSHGDKKSYLTWIYNQFNVKKGTLLQSGKARHNPSSETPNMSFSETKHTHHNTFLDKLSNGKVKQGIAEDSL